mmetsp:Transcript_136/g.154  ORF Transcript_136/g.154 Transcript_136/m.154 type:complete len:284 (+) Transcript_136:164-1015(+)
MYRIATIPFFVVVLVVSILVLVASSSSSNAAEEEEKRQNIMGDMLMPELEEQVKGLCKEIVKEGLCVTQKDIMKEYCQEACIEWEQSLTKTENAHDPDNEFFSLSAKDKTGKLIDFDRFEGYLTMVLNLGLTCMGDDDDKKNPQVAAVQQGLNEFDKLLNVWPHGLEIIVFPFQAPKPGAKEEEEDDCDLADIKTVVSALTSQKVHIMEPVYINDGKDTTTTTTTTTHPVFQYFKKLFQMEAMDSRLATYFFVNPDGNAIFKYYAASFDQVKKYLRQILERDL